MARPGPGHTLTTGTISVTGSPERGETGRCEQIGVLVVAGVDGEIDDGPAHQVWSERRTEGLEGRP